MSKIDTQEILDQCEPNIKVAAAQVARRYRGYVTFSDMEQEAQIWVMTHPRTVFDRLQDGKRGNDRITRQLAKHLHSIARTEKASVSGYNPEDEVFYSQAVVEMILPALWDETLMVQGPQGEPSEGRSNSDPSEGGNWQVMVADVRAAYDRSDLDVRQRVALVMRYHEQATLTEIGRALEVSKQGAQGVVRSALGRLVNYLGGTDPHHSCGYECECGRSYGGPGSRRAISNATARAITDGNYDE